MDDKTKRIEELEARAAELAADIAALKADNAPKFKKGDRVYMPVVIERYMDDGSYRLTQLHGFAMESDLLPAAPALVPVVPGELKPGDEVYVKARFIKIDDDGDVQTNMTWTYQGDDITATISAIPANVYQVR